MEWLNLLCAAIAAIASIIAVFFAMRNDKAHIRKCIRKKEQKIKELENQKFLKYHNKIMIGVVTPEDDKVEKLKREIEDLEDRL